MYPYNHSIPIGESLGIQSLLIDGNWGWGGGGGGGQAPQNNFCSARTAKKQIMQRVPAEKKASAFYCPDPVFVCANYCSPKKNHTQT